MNNTSRVKELTGTIISQFDEEPVIRLVLISFSLCKSEIVKQDAGREELTQGFFAFLLTEDPVGGADAVGVKLGDSIVDDPAESLR